MLVARRPIFVYIDLPLWFAAITVPFVRVPVSFPPDINEHREGDTSLCTFVGSIIKEKHILHIAR